MSELFPNLNLAAVGQQEKIPPLMATSVFVKVAVERSLDRAGTGRGAATAADNVGELTYRSDTQIEVGERVEVPLGRANQKTAGIVVAIGGPEMASGFALDRIKLIARATGARLPERLIELARWMAAYYLCPLGMVLSSMMPAAVKHGVGQRTIIELERLPEADEAALLQTVTMTASMRRAFDAVIALGRAELPLPPRVLADRISERSLGGINRLLRSGLLREVSRELVRGFGASGLDDVPSLAGSGIPTPTAAQQAIIAGIAEELRHFHVHLLRGVTGSGKTEIYLRLVGTALANGRSSIILVPEISLTPQAAARFTQRFGPSNVVVLHSRLNASQRHRQWSLAGMPGPKVVIGARSALFAPVESVGLIIVDEEHSTDYKQDQLPRYHARDVAIKLGHMEGVPVILGSATPSLESWLNAVSRPPKFKLWELSERVGGGRLPEVRIVDLADERRARLAALRSDGDERRGHSRRPDEDCIGPTLEAAMNDTLHGGGQILLLQNRRGFASRIACPSTRCGWSLRCDQCDASMVFHRRFVNTDGSAGRWQSGGRGEVERRHAAPTGHVCCHHCLAEQLLPTHCPVCNLRVVHWGAGTQKIEDELERRFAAHHLVRGGTLFRVDGDTMRSGNDYTDVLSRFARGDIRVLIGTQIISKGLDFPNVRLVGVIDADTSLHLPDFRAAERTFQLVSQVVGRAGRAGATGLAIVQTSNSRQPALRHAQAHDYRSFAREELELRRHSNLPPLWRMARIVVRDQVESKALEHATLLKGLLVEAAAAIGHSETLHLLGPLPCPVSRIAMYYRIAIEMMAPERRILQQTLARLRERGMLKSDSHTAVDVDPVSLM